MPRALGPGDLLKTLGRLNLMAAVAKGKKISVPEIDAALRWARVPVEEHFPIKALLDSAELLSPSSRRRAVAGQPQRKRKSR
jgi:hypothetical protein